MAGHNSKKSNLYAALGAATGLSNAFRFPALAASYGCSFFVAYFCALIFVCFPLLCAELGVARRGGLPAFITRAAAANSFIVALYYAVVSARLSVCGAAPVFGDDGDEGSALMLAFSLVTVLAGAFVLLKRRALDCSGKASVVCFFALFGCLALRAAFALVRGDCALAFNGAALSGGAIWCDALGQALLSLSLAAGVMPTFAATLPHGFSTRSCAAKIIISNLAGCVLAALATLPFLGGAPAEGGLSFAFTVYPRVISATAKTATGSKIFTFALYQALTAVAVHSMCSLALPALDCGGIGGALAFCIAALLAFPLLALCGGVLDCVDRACCSVNAVVLAVAESVRFFKGARGRAKRACYAAVTAACAALLVLSVCGARFSSYPIYAQLVAALCSAAVAACAAGKRRLIGLAAIKGRLIRLRRGPSKKAQ